MSTRDIFSLEAENFFNMWCVSVFHEYRRKEISLVIHNTDYIQELLGDSIIYPALRYLRLYNTIVEVHTVIIWKGSLCLMLLCIHNVAKAFLVLFSIKAVQKYISGEIVGKNPSFIHRWFIENSLHSHPKIWVLAYFEPKKYTFKPKFKFFPTFMLISTFQFVLLT